MAVFSSGYYLVGSWSSNSGEHTVKLYEYSDGGEFENWPVTQKSIVLLDEVVNTGRQGNPFSRHLRGELQLNIIDEDNHFRDRFKAAYPGQFYIHSEEPSRSFVGFPVSDFIGGRFWKNFNVRTFVFGDGITTLKTQPNTYTDYIQLGDFFYQILNDIGIQFSINIVMDYMPELASGQSDILPQQIQILPSDFVHNIVNPSKYDLIIAVIEYFGFQIWQEKGDWWIVQRNIRDNAPSVYKRTSSGWSTSTYPVAEQIQLSDFRIDESEDLDFQVIGKYERTITKKDQVFITNDPEFHPNNWTAGEPDFWPGTGNVSNLSLPDRLNFDDRSPSRSQEILRIINEGDLINLRFKAEYELFDSLADGTYNIQVASIEAVAVNHGTSYWLNEDGTWSSSFAGIGDEIIVSGIGYSTALNKDITLESDPLPIGFEGYIKINLDLTGDTGAFVTTDPIQYEMVNITESELSDIIKQVNYSGISTGLTGGGSVRENVYGNDEIILSAHPSVLFYDGSSWERITGWSSRYYTNRELNTIIVSNELRQRSVNHGGYQLKLPTTFDIKLSQILTFEQEPGVTFIPYFISLRKKEKHTLLQLSKLTDSADVALTAFES